MRQVLRRARRVLHREQVLVAECGGSVLYYPADSLIGGYVASGRGWDTVLVPLLKTLVPRDDPFVVEVGSNIGSGILQIKLAKPDASIHAFEPSPRFHPFLLRNIEANAWTNVVVEPVLVSSGERQMKLHSNATTASVVVRHYDSHRFVKSSTGTTVTLDGRFEEGPPIDFLKVDTDGHDFDVLLGARTLLERDRPVLFTEFDPSLLEQAGRDPIEFLRYLVSVGYESFLVLSNYGEALAVCTAPGDIMVLVEGEIYLDLIAVGRAEQAALLPGLLGEIAARHSLRPHVPSSDSAGPVGPASDS